MNLLYRLVIPVSLVEETDSDHLVSSVRSYPPAIFFSSSDDDDAAPSCLLLLLHGLSSGSIQFNRINNIGILNSIVTSDKATLEIAFDHQSSQPGMVYLYCCFCRW